MGLGRLEEGRRKNRGTVVQETPHYKCKYLMTQIIPYGLIPIFTALIKKATKKNRNEAGGTNEEDSE
jgi:hypothetical protein